MNNIHYGIQCDRCGIEPIVGIRYKCKVCRGDHQTDLCEDCISKNYENGKNIEYKVKKKNKNKNKNNNNNNKNKNKKKIIKIEIKIKKN